MNLRQHRTISVQYCLDFFISLRYNDFKEEFNMNKLGIIGIAAGAVCGLAYAVKKSIGKQKLHPCCF